MAVVSYREHPDYLAWRLRVFRRDDFTCQFCGAKGGKLEAHHKNSYDAFVDQRVKVENGVTLCLEHHEAFHERFGRGNNTEKQFEKFMRKRTYKKLKNLMKRLFE